MFIINNKKIFLSISAILIILSLAMLFVFPPKVGIDFKGGALTEIVYETDRPTQIDLEKAFKSTDLDSIVFQPTGELGYLVKSRDLNEAEHNLLLETLALDGKNILSEKSFNSIGPSVGRELTQKAIMAIILVSFGIIFFIAFAFRKVSKPISSWKYGFMAIISLLHDITIPIGLFALLTHYYGAEIDTLFVVGVLTILGLSVSDTIVIFDRIRENLREQASTAQVNFNEIVGKSLEQSYVRSISTSLATILVLLSLFFFGPDSTKYFALMLTVGMFFGTYSSIFLASPLLVLINELQQKKNK